MKRILMLLTVVALMMVMVAMSVAPAFAAPSSPCSGNGSGSLVSALGEIGQYDRNADGWVCKYDRYDHNGFYVSSRYKDDRLTA